MITRVKQERASVIFFALSKKQVLLWKKINDFTTIPANAIHYIDHRSKAIANVLLHSLLPVVFAGGADNLLQNLLILGLQHVAEWLQLATLLKACTMGLKIGLVVYFIRFSYKMGNRFTTSMHRQSAADPIVE
ncbi:MAG: hypothetical protein QM743_05975 [Chitinophagaceae bacterium]